MANPQIQHSLHGREIGLGLKNELILRDEARSGLNDAQVLVWSIARVTVTTAQVLALNATPITLVAAPGALKAIIVDHIELYMDYAGTQYVDDAGDDLAFSYTDGSGIQVCPPIDGADFIGLAADAYAYTPGVEPNAVQGMVPVVNAAVVISMLTGEVITGDSDIIVHTYYRIVDTVLTA